jgi:lipoprotein-anchoring transpeptidase ErfK/SrfK
VKVVVSIPLQKAYVFQDGELVATSPVSTGKRGHETPAGTFRILQKKVHHRSSKYDNAPMPYMQRLTWYGIALHAGRVPGYPASHGCIRLPRSFAKKLYGMTDYGTSVTVTKRRPKSAEEALNLA